MGFAQNLRNLRIKKGLSQKAFSEMAGVSQNSIYQWEKGICIPRIERLQKIATALGVSVSDLIGQDSLDLAEDVISLFLNNPPEKLDVISLNDPQENYLMTKFRELNETGQKKATDCIDDLTEIPKYRKPSQD